MDRAPLPPHERSWRHPSELGLVADHEPTTSGGRALIVTTATLGLLLVGVLAVSMTPDRTASPESAVSAISGLRTAPVSALALDEPALPMVTPLGDQGWAVTTMSALAGRSGRLEVRIPSGAVVLAEIVNTDRSSGLTVVSVPASAGYQLAHVDPAPTDTVLVHGDPPVVVTMNELARLDVAEATPVVDGDGKLIGLCTQEPDGIALRTVATMPEVDAVTTVAGTSPPRHSTVSSTAPTTTSAATLPPTTSIATMPLPTTVPPTPTPTTVSPTRPSVTGADAATTVPG